MNFDREYDEYLKLFNGKLYEVLNSLDEQAPDKIKDAIKYAVTGGGKRIRPVLCIAATKALGGNPIDALEYAVALEFIHSYSLVHDDLPAMDNDDYRRGQLSTHKKFGEAIGILAGDALLNLAFEICLSKNNFSDKDFAALKVLADCSGYIGMIAGQVLDIYYEGKNVGEKQMYEIYAGKTAKLITAPLLIASALCGGKYRKELEQAGYHLGIMFQISDDLLDVTGDLETIGKTPNKDELMDKLTSVKILGINGASLRAKEHYLSAVDYLNKIPSNNFLLTLAGKIYERKT